MDLSEVLTISGKPGLYRIIAQNPGRVIVESILDGKRSPVFMRHNFSILKEISLYTEEGDMPLDEAFTAIYEYEKGKESIDPKSANSELEERLGTIIPSYDKDEVSHADMKKLFKWYNLLVGKGLWSPEDAMSEEEQEAPTKKVPAKSDEEE